MARKQQIKGNCTYCNKEMTRGGLSNHLKSCSARREAIAQATGPEQDIYHLVVQDAWGGSYWLHLEMTGDSKLKDLDNYLRSIWLECCGHLSEFSIGRAWSGREMGMSRTISNAFSAVDELIHIYDFGTSSETKVKRVNVRTGASLTGYPVTLMARNHLPAVECQECEKPAIMFCIECNRTWNISGHLCKEHIANHPCENYAGPIEIANSPRMGMCGYTGPANQPY